MWHLSPGPASRYRSQLCRCFLLAPGILKESNRECLPGFRYIFQHLECFISINRFHNSNICSISIGIKDMQCKIIHYRISMILIQTLSSGPPPGSRAPSYFPKFCPLHIIPKNQRVGLSNQFFSLKICCVVFKKMFICVLNIVFMSTYPHFHVFRLSYYQVKCPKMPLLPLLRISQISPTINRTSLMEFA